MPTNSKDPLSARAVSAAKRSIQFSAPLLLSALLVGCDTAGSGIDGESGFVGSTHVVADGAKQAESPDAGSGPRGPEVDGAIATSVPSTRFELAEGGETFVGSVELRCDSAGAPDSWRQRTLPVQFTLKSDGAGITGMSWSLPFYLMGAASGTTDAAGTTIKLALNADDYSVPELELTDVSLDAAGLHANTAGDVDGRSGDLRFTCKIEGPATFIRDAVPPTVDGVPTGLAGFAPIELFFSEPMRSNATIMLLGSGQATTITPVLATDELMVGVTITTDEVWLSGESTLRIEGAMDVAGNLLDATTWPIAVPAEYQSATTNPGFEEAADGTTGPWYFGNCSVKSREADIRGLYPDLLPEEGAQFLACPSNGQVLQAYIAPPAEATHLLLDVASAAANGGFNDVVPLVTLTLRNGGESVILQPVEPNPDVEPIHLQSFRGELPGNGAPVWLIVDYAGYMTPVLGLPYGTLLVDNLRFE